MQEGNYWTWRGGMCPVFPTPGSAPVNSGSIKRMFSSGNNNSKHGIE